MRTPRTKRAGLLAAALLLLAPAAYAAGPQVNELDPERCTPGSVLKVKGLNFSDVVADVEVTIGTEKASCLQATPQELTVFVPQTLKAGSFPIIVKVSGAASNKDKKVQIVTGAEAEKEQRERDRQQNELVGPGAETQMGPKMLVLDPPIIQRERGAIAIEVAGDAQYPDGCVIFVSLKMEKRFVAGAEAPVAGGRFKAVIGPFTRNVFAGNYAIEAEFQLYSQPRNVQRQFKRTFQGTEAEIRQQAHDRQYVRVGTPEDERQQLAGMRRHFEQTIEQAHKYLGDLEERYAASGRSMFRASDGSVKELEWEDWLKRRSLKGLGETDFRRMADELKKGSKGCLNKQNYFDDAAWREWLDHSWRGEVLGLAKAHITYRDSWEVVRFHSAMLEMEEALSVLMRLSQRRSQDLYRKNGLPDNEADRKLQGADVLSLGSGSVSPGRVRALLKSVQKEVGLQQEERPTFGED